MVSKPVPDTGGWVWNQPQAQGDRLGTCPPCIYWWFYAKPEIKPFQHLENWLFDKHLRSLCSSSNWLNMYLWYMIFIEPMVRTKPLRVQTWKWPHGSNGRRVLSVWLGERFFYAMNIIVPWLETTCFCETWRWSDIRSTVSGHAIGNGHTFRWYDVVVMILLLCFYDKSWWTNKN